MQTGPKAIVKKTPSTRDMKQALLRGFKRKCPRCGEARLFAGYLSVNENCASCDLPFHEHRADDAPAWLTMVLALHLVVPIMLYVSTNYSMSDAANMVLWPTLISIVTLTLLPLLKGSVIGFQWAKGMHGFAAEH